MLLEFEFEYWAIVGSDVTLAPLLEKCALDSASFMTPTLLGAAADDALFAAPVL